MFEHKPPISLQSELAEIERNDGTSTRAIRELKDQLVRFNSNSNTLDPAEALADKWKRDKCGREWTRDRVAALVWHALKVRREVNALNPEAWELFVNVITTGETPDWYKDWQ
jgi:hypothetical protein